MLARSLHVRTIGGATRARTRGASSSIPRRCARRDARGNRAPDARFGPPFPAPGESPTTPDAAVQGWSRSSLLRRKSTERRRFRAKLVDGADLCSAENFELLAAPVPDERSLVV